LDHRNLHKTLPPVPARLATPTIHRSISELAMACRYVDMRLTPLLLLLLVASLATNIFFHVGDVEHRWQSRGANISCVGYVVYAQGRHGWGTTLPTSDASRAHRRRTARAATRATTTVAAAAGASTSAPAASAPPGDATACPSYLHAS
jgi:hypothetical protein